MPGSEPGRSTIPEKESPSDVSYAIRVRLSRQAAEMPLLFPRVSELWAESKGTGVFLVALVRQKRRNALIIFTHQHHTLFLVLPSLRCIPFLLQRVFGQAQQVHKSAPSRRPTSFLPSKTLPPISLSTTATSSWSSLHLSATVAHCLPLSALTSLLSLLAIIYTPPSYLTASHPPTRFSDHVCRHSAQPRDPLQEGRRWPRRHRRQRHPFQEERWQDQPRRRRR